MSFLFLTLGELYFLSCLLGSEHLFFRIEKISHFLSCLYGSEHQVINHVCKLVISKLPIRQ